MAKGSAEAIFTAQEFGDFLIYPQAGQLYEEFVHHESDPEGNSITLETRTPRYFEFADANTSNHESEIVE